MIETPKSILAWIYDASFHCPADAEAKFGAALYRLPPPLGADGFSPIPVGAAEAVVGLECAECRRPLLPATRHPATTAARLAAAVTLVAITLWSCHVGAQDQPSGTGSTAPTVLPDPGQSGTVTGPGTAALAVPCDDRTTIEALLRKYGEVSTGSGVDTWDGLKDEVFVNPTTGTYSIIHWVRQDYGCMISAGQEWTGSGTPI